MKVRKPGALAALKEERNARLAATDWTQIAGNPLPKPARRAWARYRQALRDLPALTKDPSRPVWPAPPKS